VCRPVAVQVSVHGRVDQGRQLRPVGLIGAELKRRGSGQVATGAIAGNGDAIRCGPELRGAIDRIDEAGHDVVEGGREPRLPGEAVVQREHLHPGGLGEKSAEAVVCLDAADLPAPAVDEHHQPRTCGCPIGLVQTRPPVVPLATSHDQVPPARIVHTGTRSPPLQVLEELQLHGRGRIGCRRQRALGAVGQELQTRAQALPVDRRAPARQGHEQGIGKREDGVRGTIDQGGSSTSLHMEKTT
jgi:hypothetical protein